jgi:hypothetical protein
MKSFHKIDGDTNTIRFLAPLQNHEKLTDVNLFDCDSSGISVSISDNSCLITFSKEFLEKCTPEYFVYGYRGHCFCCEWAETIYISNEEYLYYQEEDDLNIFCSENSDGVFQPEHIEKILMFPFPVNVQLHITTNKSVSE